MLQRTAVSVLSRLGSSSISISSISVTSSAFRCTLSQSSQSHSHESRLSLKSQSLLLQSRRSYDKKLYRRITKLEKAVENQEDITLEIAIDVIKTYSLGQDKLITAHVFTAQPEEGARPIRGDVVLPVPLPASAEINSTILVFATGTHAEEAKKLGAQYVGGEDLIEQVVNDKIKFDQVLSTKAMFPQVVKIAKVLGPKGLMPSPARGTVSDDIPTMMAMLRATSKFEIDSEFKVSLPISRANWASKDIIENLRAFFKAVIAAKPSKVDASTFVQNVALSAPLVPLIQLPLRPLRDLFKI